LGCNANRVSQCYEALRSGSALVRRQGDPGPFRSPAAAQRLGSCAQHEKGQKVKVLLRKQVVAISSKPQGASREAEAESSGEQKLRVDVQKPDLRRCTPGRAGEQPRSSSDQRGVAYIRRSCSEGLVSYLGRSRLAPERATPGGRSEKSAEAVVAEQKREGVTPRIPEAFSSVKGQTERRAKRP
jgi:hypothetical protein